jgi:hypothetical protein
MRAFLLLLLLAGASNTGALAAGNAGFGDAPTYASDNTFNYSVSDDKKAFTMTFSNLGIATQSSSPPIVTQAFSMVLPAAGMRS